MKARNGAGTITSHGYRKLSLQYEGKYEHVLVVERILGRPLPKGIEIHHVNEIKTDNRPSNLVVCPNRDYHRLLHRRTRAYDACGHADWMKCSYCGKYDDPKNLAHVDKSPRHVECQRQYSLRRRREKYHMEVRGHV